MLWQAQVQLLGRDSSRLCRYVVDLSLSLWLSKQLRKLQLQHRLVLQLRIVHRVALPMPYNQLNQVEDGARHPL
jgi:hypothetical protein